MSDKFTFPIELEIIVRNTETGLEEKLGYGDILHATDMMRNSYPDNYRYNIATLLMLLFGSYVCDYPEGLEDFQEDFIFNSSDTSVMSGELTLTVYEYDKEESDSV